MSGISSILRVPRASFPGETPEDIAAFIASRASAHATKLEDEFVARALGLGVESGMVLDVGARVGLVVLKIVNLNESFVGMGVDTVGPWIERARETATAWELADRAVFPVGDARRMRLKTGYFDLVVSDCALHRFDDGVSVLAEIARVLKPRGALLLRDFRRPNRWGMASAINAAAAPYDAGMGPQLSAAIRASYSRAELVAAVQESGLQGAAIHEQEPGYLLIERRGATDPGSWVTAREQYR